VAGEGSPREDGDQGVTIVLVDDHAVVAKGVELLLRRYGHHVVGVSEDPESAYRMIDARRPQVAVIDLDLPGENGAQLTRRLLDRDEQLAIVIYTGTSELGLLAEALDCGARGFTLKSANPSELAEAIKTVAAGGSYMDPRLQSTVLSQDTTQNVGQLSPREREILDGIARGLRGEQIAAQLTISPETVRTHVRNAMEKLEAHTRAHAVAIALRQGEITL
jgi:DNA-binding NarL/FixJ family response regulator